MDSGELDRAEQISAGLPEMYRYLIVGRVSLARGEPAAALQNLEAAIRLWPNHAVARYLAGQAALRLGDPERAVEELREAWRNGKGQTDAAVALAQLQLARGQLDEAAEFARLYLGRPESRGRPAAAEALAVLVRVAAARGEDAAVAELLGALAKRPGQAARAAAESAALARDAGDLRGAVAAIDASGLDLADPAHHLALASLVQDLASADETRKALARLDAVIEAQGENAALLDLRGRVLALAERGEEAQTAFEAALALDASYAPALAGLATLAADRGQREQALELFERAAKAAPERSGPAYHAASLSLELGRREEALGLLEEIVRRDPGHAEARNDLAWLLAESGADLDRAVALAEEASAMRPGSNTLDTLGFARLRKGDVEGAVEAFERSLARDPTAASVRYRLGVALARRGEPQAARAAWRAALETSADFPEAQAAREALARLPAASPSL